MMQRTILNQMFRSRPPERGLYLAPPFLVSDYQPRARHAYRTGLLKERMEEAREELRSCEICPRNCAVNRLENRMGACHTGRLAINWDISQKKNGWELKAEEIADLMLKLQTETKCHNINLVTPEHVVPQVIEAVYHAVEQGLNLPIVYNTSGYDSLRSLQLLDGIVDIYMPDFKFWTAETSLKLCKAKDYPDVTKRVIKEMHRQVGDLIFDESGLAKSGLLVRHLVMPGLLEEGKRILEFLAEDISVDTYVNIMEQYRPTFKVGTGETRSRGGFTTYDEIDRPVQSAEMEEMHAHAKKLGLWRLENNELLTPPLHHFT